MATVKLIQIDESPWDKRWDELKAACLKSGVTLETKIVTVSADQNTTLDEIKKAYAEKADIIVIDPRSSTSILTDSFPSTLASFHIRACDLLIRDKAKWWPRCFIEESFVKTITHHVKEIDQRRGALIVGANGLARLLAPALTKLGYKVIHIAEEDDNKGSALVGSLKSKIFDVEFRFISIKEIMQLPGNYSMLINTLPLKMDAKILDELYFFNFLSSGSVVVDLNIIPYQTPLLAESERFGTRRLSGVYLAAETDVALAKEYLKINIDEAQYTTALVEKAKSEPFDMKPYLERFQNRGVF